MIQPLTARWSPLQMEVIALSHGGDIIRVVTCTSQTNLTSLSNSTTDNAWIGLYHQTENCRNHSLCNWMWTDGSELGFMNWPPNGIPAFPKCASIIANGIWGNNQVCNGRLDFICERGVWYLTTTPVVTTMMTTEYVVDRSTTVVNANPTVESNEEYDDGDDDIPIIIGCVVGGLVLVTIITVVAVVLLKRHRRSSQADQSVRDKDEETPPVAKHVRYNPGYEDVDSVETQGQTNVTFKPSPDNTDTGAHGVGDNLYSEAIKKEDRPGSKGILVKENTLYGSGK